MTFSTDPLLGFSPGTFVRRRSRALESLGGGVLLLPSAPPLYRSRDTEYRYRPDSELFYLTGCREPGALALLRGQEEGKSFVLFVPRRDPKAELWSGPRLGPEEARELFGADETHPAEEMEERLPDLLAGSTRVFHRLGKQEWLDALVVKALDTARRRGARKGRGPRGVDDPGQLLDEFRLRKDPEELERIRRAASLTTAAFRETILGVRPGMGEWEVESLLEGAFRRRGARGPAFPTIVGSGANACTLHYTENLGVVGKGELVLLDGGAEVDLHAGDVTRTFPVDRRFTEAQRAVYDTVLGAHRAALAAVRPGATIAGVHSAAVETLTRGLVELGVLEGGVEARAGAKAHEPWFPHQTSHWLGLDVHDVGDYAVEGASRVLEPGMVLTVEPGLYFSPEAPGTPFDGIGVRIEDDILVTKEGAENLTGDLPVLPEEVEALVGG